jgi:Flp pilus assembly protein TadD/SAM-dependent methyltransferase
MPDSADLHNCLGRVLHEMREYERAGASYGHALTLDAGHASAMSNLGALFMDCGKLKPAAVMLRKAIEVDPGRLEAYSNLGTVLSKEGDLRGAVDCFQRVLRERPTYVPALCSLGFLHDCAGDEEGAVGYFRLALAAEPDSPVALFNMAPRWLAEGDFARGWRAYEERWGVRLFSSKRRKLAQPQWRGEDIAGKRVFLYSEQGFGDTLHFVRYVPMVAALGAEVVLEVQAALGRVLGDVPGAARVIAGGEELPAEFDFHCPLMSLPGVFGTDFESIPAEVPYVFAEKELAGRWAERITGCGLRVGMVWSGNPQHTRDKLRSVALAEFGGVLGVPGVTFYSLQKGPAVAELAGIDRALRPESLDAELLDFADTAAAIANLDLVICVDTAVAHLAGAMGKPVWVLVPAASDWRWLKERTDSPWYPTMRLFRQEKLREWGGVLASVQVELEVLAGAQVREDSRKVEAAPSSAIEPVRVASTKAAQCKVCGGTSPLFGVVDLNKSCAEAKGLKLPLAGCPVYYQRCRECGFCFTTAFDEWDFAAFRQHIYNEDYLLVDPDFVQVRPEGNARLVAEAFAAAKGAISLLDYGGGSGLLAKRLREQGFSAETYDPFSEFNQLPVRRFDLVTCFEVMEHVPDPRETLRTMAGLMEEGGVILFSTLVQPKEFEQMGLGWWYAGPRNGHVSLYTTGALARLFAEFGLKVASFSEGLHVAYAKVPQFAQHLGLPG